MNKNDLAKKLKKDIQDLYSISGRFDDVLSIHQIDIDLALSKVRNLYDLLLKLNTEANQKQEYKEEINPEYKKDITKNYTNEVPIHEKEEAKEELTKEPDFVIESSKKEEKVPEPKKSIKPKQTEKKQNGDSPEIIAEKFQSKKFMHDTIANKNSKKDISSKLQSKPINDINTAIGLNDKFIFIRELFNGDKEYYNETIQLLNNFDTYENAIEFLHENFDWEQDDLNVERLKELVRRKYIVNKK